MRHDCFQSSGVGLEESGGGGRGGDARVTFHTNLIS